MNNPNTRIENMLEVAEKRARKVILELQGQLMPTWVLIDADCNGQIMATSWNNDHEKMIAEMFIKARMSELKTVAYCVMSEVWMARYPEYKPGIPIKMRPSENPARMEAVMIFATDGETKVYRCWEIKRLGGKAIALEIMEEAEEVEGWMTNML